MTLTLSDDITTADRLLDGLDVIDLSMVRMKLMDVEEGAGWSSNYCDRIEREYRRYLALARYYAPQAVVPSKIVDTFWHYHILDTRAYAEDCQNAFGYFLHHFPYFGMRGSEDMQALADSYDRTLHLYKIHFGIAPDEVWVRDGMSRCPKCGRAA